MSDRDKQKKKHNHWPLRVFFMAVVLSALLSFFSSTALEGTGYAVALAVLAAFIALGIVFDMVGVGDICGIVSGSTAAVIVTQLQRDLSTHSVLLSIGITALISGITIGGKALGKTVAINDCTNVVYRVARVMHTLHLFR